MALHFGEPRTSRASHCERIYKLRPGQFELYGRRHISDVFEHMDEDEHFQTVKVFVPFPISMWKR